LQLRYSLALELKEDYDKNINDKKIRRSYGKNRQICYRKKIIGSTWQS
jgi:hypothetical protein